VHRRTTAGQEVYGAGDMPKLSIITPAYAATNPYILETYRSLQAQTEQDWEWIVLLNNGGVLPTEAAADPRTRTHVVEVPEGRGIGWLKGEACTRASSPYLLELDGDDLLAPVALELVLRAFEQGADFVYSDCAEFKDGTWEPNVYGEVFGWTSYEVELDGHKLRAMSSPPATAQNLRRIEWAPNHLRAWRRSTYMDVGGHNRAMTVADDHELLVRCYLAGHRFHHVARCLYFYRVHPQNTVKLQNGKIQNATHNVYLRFVEQLAERFADEAGLEKVDLCGGINPRPGFLALDRQAESADARLLACDLNEPWPLPDNSVGVIRAFDALEHLRDPVHTMNEAWRVLAPGGFLLTHTPSTDGRGAFCDPTHVSFWNHLSFRYYTDHDFARFVPAIRCRFQLAHLATFYPSEWHRANHCPYVAAHLLAVKPGFHPMGECRWPRQRAAIAWP